MFCPKCNKNCYVLITRSESGDESYPVQKNIRCAECGHLISSTNIVAD